MDKDEILMHQLFQTVRAITKGVNAVFAKQGLFSSEWSIITTLKQTGALTQSDLAAYLNIEAPAISRSLGVLEKKGFITRLAGRDRREKQVFLSERANGLYANWLEASSRHRKTVLAGLDEEARVALSAALAMLFANAQNFTQVEESGEAR